mgnify:CR=1 FL=1
MELPVSEVMIRHRNPDASEDLIIPVHIICNTSDEQLIDNITKNSRLEKEWLKASEPHNGIAVICGSGPSVADHLQDILGWHMEGATIFALNGCAKFLAENGIVADYQVIVDARPENVQLIGPAKNHLFASQCHPDMFEAVPDAILWHLQIGDIESYFPEYQDGYMMIGGAASVGNTTTCLAYGMGFRELHLYGYDSSHREGKGHAFHQQLNAGDPVLWTEWNGKRYLSSFTMKHQAEKFMETARELKRLGTKIHLHGTGLLPDMWNTPALPEVEKYKKMWEIDRYRSVSPGELVVSTFLDVVKPSGTVADFGCGTGRGGLGIWNAIGLPVTLVDFTENSRDEAARNLPFVLADLTGTIPVWADHGYCCDVMEHIPPEDVDAVIKNIMASCDDCFFQISTVPDIMGAEIGQDLHLTVEPHAWWKNKFVSLGFAVAWEQEQDIAALFHILNRSHK